MSGPVAGADPADAAEGIRAQVIARADGALAMVLPLAERRVRSTNTGDAGVRVIAIVAGGTEVAYS